MYICTCLLNMHMSFPYYQIRLVLGWAFSKCKRVDRTVLQHPCVKVYVAIMYYHRHCHGVVVTSINWLAYDWSRAPAGYWNIGPRLSPSKNKIVFMITDWFFWPSVSSWWPCLNTWQYYIPRSSEFSLRTVTHLQVAPRSRLDGSLNKFVRVSRVAQPKTNFLLCPIPDFVWNACLLWIWEVYQCRLFQ